MDEDTYLKERLENQIAWLSGKSAWNQKWFKRLQITSIIASASIPLLAGLIEDGDSLWKIGVGVLGVVVAAITAVVGLCKFQENWLRYRATCESLKREKFLYLTRSAPYDQDDPFKRLVERVEGILAEENKGWRDYMKKNEGEQPPQEPAEE